jgi:hypothetical protein
MCCSVGDGLADGATGAGDVLTDGVAGARDG